MKRPFASVCAAFALSAALPCVARADPALDSFARDLDRTESVRAVKKLQYLYAQYAQYGLWNQVGALFTPNGSLVFDGLVKQAQTSQGPAAIAAFLRTRYGGGHEGLKAGDLSTMMIDAPVVNLSRDGNSANVRWEAMIFHGHDGAARVEGGMFENEYVRVGGVWKIATAHYYPEYDGPYEEGWTNWGGGELPVVPRHYTADSAGVPIPPPTGAAPASKASLAALSSRVARLNDEDRIRNLQSAFGFYEDRKMWDDVVDMFAANGVVEVGGQGVWRGPRSIRRWLETRGPAGLKHGQLNDRVHFDTTVTILPGGNEAEARGIELGMLGEADEEKGWWEVAVFRNRFVKEDGVWKIREMRRYPMMKADVFQGWGKSRIVDGAPAGIGKPDASIPAGDAAAPGLALPAFLEAHPVTGKAVGAVGAAKVVANRNLTGPIAPGIAAPVTLDEAHKRLARSAAWDGAMNVAVAYGHFIDDEEPRGFMGVLAAKGYKETPFSGFYVGRAKNIASRVRGPAPTRRQGISYHWLVQPVLTISEDGRSGTGRARLFQPRTGKTVGKAGDFFGASFWGGMYHDRYVLEDGIWRVWELTLDEPYITPVAFKDGIWAKSKDPPPPDANTPPRRSLAAGATNFTPDVLLRDIGKREEGFSGGPGKVLQWPSIMPMWFSYKNPVSGRVPELYHPDCVPCTIRPDLRLTANGYQEPPDAADFNKAP